MDVTANGPRFYSSGMSEEASPSDTQAAPEAGAAEAVASVTFPGGAGLLEAAVASSTNGIVIADATRPDLPLLYVNPAFEAMTGYTAAEAVGSNCRFLQGGRRDQDALDTLRASLRDGTPCHILLQNFRKDGTPFWNELHIAPIRDADGRLTHFVGVQTDVTTRVENEARLRDLREALERQNVELAELNEQKNHFLGMAAHDIRNPLTAITFTTRMLADQRTGPLTAKQRELVRKVDRAASVVLHLVNDLLDVSKIEAGELTLALQETDLCSVVLEVLDQYADAAGNKQIRIVPSGTGEPAPATVDPAKFRQVVDNLVSNALKFSPARTVVRLSLERSADEVLLHVRDEGPGIPPAEVDRIFRPFSLTSVKSTAGEPSTGLGLAICKKVVEGHRGRIWVDSAPGQGATFHVGIPSRPGAGTS